MSEVHHTTTLYTPFTRITRYYLRINDWRRQRATASCKVEVDARCAALPLPAAGRQRGEEMSWFVLSQYVLLLFECRKKDLAEMSAQTVNQNHSRLSSVNIYYTYYVSQIPNSKSKPFGVVLSQYILHILCLPNPKQ